MERIRRFHPAVAVIWFVCVLLPTVLGFHPLVQLFSFLQAFVLSLSCRVFTKVRSHLWFLLLGLLLALLNPLWNPRGQTVLFFINDNPVTAESLAYGAGSALSFLAALYWFYVFAQWMTGDKWQCVLKGLGPGFRMLFTMTMRFVPLLIRRLGQVRNAQKALGVYAQEDLLQIVGSEVRVFSSLVTWSLENGIHTSDSMLARGYGSGKQTSYFPFVFKNQDRCSLLVCLGLFSLVAVSLFTGRFTLNFFPTLGQPISDLWFWLSFGAYQLLMAFPLFFRLGEVALWPRLR